MPRQTTLMITEADADARSAVMVLTASSLAIIAIALGLWTVWHGIGSAKAQPAPILAKSELSREQIARLNVMPTVSEKPKHFTARRSPG